MKVISREQAFALFPTVVGMGGAAVETKPTTTLAGYLDLEDSQIRTCQITPPPFPICRCSRHSGRHCSAVSRPPKRTLARTARAVVFGTILIKKVRERCHQQTSDEQYMMYKENKVKESVSLYSIPSGSSQSLPNSISKPEIKNENTNGSRRRDADLRSCYAYTSGIGFVVVSLGVTILMQSKVIAILITLMWVYFYAWMHLGSKDGQESNKITKTKMRSTLRIDDHNRRAHF